MSQEIKQIPVPRCRWKDIIKMGIIGSRVWSSSLSCRSDVITGGRMKNAGKKNMTFNVLRQIEEDSNINLLEPELFF